MLRLMNNRTGKIYQLIEVKEGRVILREEQSKTYISISQNTYKGMYFEVAEEVKR